MKSDLYRLHRIVELGNRLLQAVDEMGITKESLSED